jgi:hypothetical protein
MKLLPRTKLLPEATMKGSPDNHPSRPAGPPQPAISVRCPNLECGKIYNLRSSAAGKNVRCTCGSVFLVPNAGAAQTAEHAAPTPVKPQAVAAPRTAQEDEAPREGEHVTEVRVGCIGRGHAGKTALLRTLGEGPVGDFFPSGLHVDAGDPREVAQMIREAEETQRLLHRCGLPPTIEASQIRYFLYDGDVQRVVYRMREVIGQVLTHTLPHSAADQQARYTQYLKSLVNTHVLWAVVPCQPANPSARDRRRYASDLRITLAYLREALRLRSLEQPVAVALVLSKIDTLFGDAEEARASLTDDVLRASFGPLVHLVEQSHRVGDAVIIPVTTFGFGNARLAEDGSDRHGASAEVEDDPFASEPIWLLREGVSAQPHNLDTLVVWTLLLGLRHLPGDGTDEEGTELGDLRRMLGDDLAGIDPWCLTIKEGVAGGGKPGRQLQGAR